ncbi:MAG TPA: glycosyltransferase family 4 protein [Acetobacteraceae bacterium]
MTASRPTLLAVCTIPPWPVTNGYALRVFNLLRELAEDWAITLIASPPDVQGEEIPLPLARYIPLDLQGAGLSYPWRFDQRPLRAAVEMAVKAYQPQRAIVWRGGEAAWFDAPNFPPGVVDLIDCTPLDLWRGFIAQRGLRVRYRKLREIGVSARFAARAARSFSSVVCAGEKDAAWLRWVGRCVGRGSSVHVISNGVVLPDGPSAGGQAPKPTLSFVGTLNFEPNVDAAFFLAREIWPVIKAACPDAELVIAGRNPTPEIQALARLPGIEVQANAPDMNVVLSRSWVSIAPMRSGVGVKNKVLEAWACSRPVVLTPLAVNGLMLPAGHERLMGADHKAMAQAVIGLFRTPAEALRMGREARDHVGQHYTWKNSAARVDALLRNAAPDELAHSADGLGGPRAAAPADAA